MIQLFPLVERHTLRIGDIRFELSGILRQHPFEFGADLCRAASISSSQGKSFTRIELPVLEAWKVEERGLGMIDPAPPQKCCETVIETLRRCRARAARDVTAIAPARKASSAAGFSRTEFMAR